MLTQKITVPLDASPPFERLKMHYGDSGRVVEATMLFNGQPFTPPSGAVATFQAKKPDGTVVIRTDGVSISNRTVIIDITANTLAQVGIVYCECLIYAAGESVGTMRFEIEVTKPAVFPGDIESADDWQGLQEARLAAQTSASAAQSSATSAAASASAASNSANTATDAAEQAADSAAQATSAATSAVNAANTYPRINSNNHWEVYNTTTQAWVDTGVEAAGADGASVNIQDGEYREPGSTKPLPDLPAFSSTAEGDAYVVDDDEIDGQYDLYFHGRGGTTWTIVDNWAGVPGPQGATGATGARGETGAQGIQGPPGPQGAPGVIQSIATTNGIALIAGGTASVPLIGMPDTAGFWRPVQVYSGSFVTGRVYPTSPAQNYSKVIFLTTAGYAMGYLFTGGKFVAHGGWFYSGSNNMNSLYIEGTWYAGATGAAFDVSVNQYLQHRAGDVHNAGGQTTITQIYFAR